MRMIDADALLASMGLTDATKWGNKSAEQRHHSYSTFMAYEIADEINGAPTVAAEPVRHGRWKHIVSWYPESDYDQCTNCGFTVSRGYGYNKSEWKFCPNCGARMDGQGEGDAE